MDSCSFPDRDENVNANTMESMESVNKGKRKENHDTRKVTSKPPKALEKI